MARRVPLGTTTPKELLTMKARLFCTLCDAPLTDVEANLPLDGGSDGWAFLEGPDAGGCPYYNPGPTRGAGVPIPDDLERHIEDGWCFQLASDDEKWIVDVDMRGDDQLRVNGRVTA